MTISTPIFVAKRFKVTVLLNAVLNVCALVILLYFINSKNVYYEITILGMLLTGLAWIIVNLCFGVLYYRGLRRDTNCRALQILIGIHFRLAVGLVCAGLVTLIIAMFVILEIMGMVVAFFIPFIMLVIIFKLPKKILPLFLNEPFAGKMYERRTKSGR